MHLVSCSRWGEALTILDRTLASGIKPQLVLYHRRGVLDACRVAGERRQVIVLLDGADECGIEGNAVSYHLFIAACGNTER